MRIAEGERVRRIVNSEVASRYFDSLTSRASSFLCSRPSAILSCSHTQLHGGNRVWLLSIPGKCSRFVITSTTSSWERLSQRRTLAIQILGKTWRKTVVLQPLNLRILQVAPQLCIGDQPHWVRATCKKTALGRGDREGFRTRKREVQASVAFASLPRLSLFCCFPTAHVGSAESYNGCSIIERSVAQTAGTSVGVEPRERCASISG
ncbi:hypothetical protein GE09DRAFT_728850 [Coniochaeta sp. 2T2.1]|nr:hypothetical protein GE09DRAFT_728850 [Coniochaeta sp. 2T2.1]